MAGELTSISLAIGMGVVDAAAPILSPPSAFTVGQWSVSDAATGGTATVTISALPSNGGSAITAIQYKAGAGAWTNSGISSTGTFNITGLTNGAAVNVLIRAVNAIGNGADSDTKSVTPTAGSAYDPDAQAYIDGYAPASSTTFKDSINAFIVGTKADGVWAKLDWLTVPADTSAGSLRNVKNLAKTAAGVNSPTFTAYRGFQGDGTAAHVDIGEPFSSAANFSQNSATLGVYVNLQVATAIAAIIGNTGTTRRHIIQIRQGTGNTNVQINSGTAAVFEVDPTTKLGHRTAVRADSASIRNFLNGNMISNPSSMSTSTIGGDNGSLLRSTMQYSPDRYALMYSGSALSDSEVSSFHSRIVAFLTAIGAN